jgi:hypothetical protein
MLQVLDVLGIFTSEFLWMVTKWKTSDHKHMVNALEDESLRNSILRALKVENGQFPTIVTQGRPQMEKERVCEQYQTEGGILLRSLTIYLTTVQFSTTTLLVYPPRHIGTDG